MCSIQKKIVAPGANQNIFRISDFVRAFVALKTETTFQQKQNW